MKTRVQSVWIRDGRSVALILKRRARCFSSGFQKSHNYYICRAGPVTWGAAHESAEYNMQVVKFLYAYVKYYEV